MKKYTLLALLFITITLVHSQDKSYDYKDASELINIWLDAQIDYEDIPSILGVVVKDQDIIWSGAFGKSNIEQNIEADTNTVCNIGSVSKVFTATAIMKLVSDGKLNLDDNIKDLLPNYTLKQTFPDSGYVTIKSLLTHSSGVPRDTKHSYWSGPDHPFPSKKELLDNLDELETDFQVGSNVQYSNLGYALLGQVIEEVSGMSYKEFIETKIFQPLAMTNSVVEMQQSDYGNKHAIGYTATNRDRKRKKANFFQTRAMQPAAGISSTVSDLAKFVSWQFRLMNNSKTELLKPELLKSMYEVQATSKNNYAKRGYGYEVYTDKEGNSWVMHGGMCPGYVTFLKMDVSNKMAYAILINASGVKALRYVNGIIDILNKVKPTNEQQTEKNTDLSEFKGFYDLNPWNSEYYIGSWGNGLVALYLPTESMKYATYYYKQKDDDVFELVNDKNEPMGEELIFYRNDEGRIIKVMNDGQYHYPKSY